ncbi:MAG: circularly permuted type 2 ATP-grasp protein [Acidobacteria bacterium]|nr:circularly permuted type 2 ATP-grasp protein [Acidobacteriota bacterium]
MDSPAAQVPVTLDPAWPYASAEGFYDEFLSAPSQLRPHWREFAAALAKMGHEELARRWQEGRRLIRENGVTYNVYGGTRSTDRPWPLDPMPLLMEPGEWNAIQAAVVQRASLLNAILADVYGPQKLLRDRRLPAELVLANPAFLRPCHNIAVPGGIYLHVYAADLARSPDGKWWVIADRAQSPSGAGYALENRIVINRVLPDVSARLHVHRVAGFFQTLRNSLLQLVPRHRENPRIVLLTPGPYSETYFEHAFLARYLGYSLVEGGDLTVRENRVFLKTLGGLLPVDVVVRRQDDSFCDPLELRGESMLGVPGLVQAARSGNVVIANALGSGLMETAASAAFLPLLCRHILGEELKMPTVATWWCGQDAPLGYVLTHLKNLVIKPAFPAPGQLPIFGERLSAKDREELMDRMRATPGRYVAQEQVSLSTVPVWEENRMMPRHAAMRVYAVAANGTYLVMPGGLARTSSSLDSMVVSVNRGGGSKDTWVLAEGPTSQLSLLRPSAAPVEINRATFDLPSRVADNLFWLGRYTERVEAAVRTARALLPRVFQESDGNRSAGSQAGVNILLALGHLEQEESDKGRKTLSLERELLSMIYDSEERGSLGWNLHQVRRVAWLLRDRISADAWRILNQLDEQFSQPAPSDALRVAAAQDLMNDAVITLSAFSGLVLECMTRGDGWRFLDLGRRLERAVQVTELLRHGLALQHGADSSVLEALLEICDSSLTYRSRYLTTLQTNLVLDLLLVDEANPRSLAFQFARLHEHVEQLPESQTHIRRPAEARVALSILTSVQLADVQELAVESPDGQLRSLDGMLTRLSGEMRQLSEALTRRYFNLALATRRLTTF